MHNFMKTIISAMKHWTQNKIKESAADWNQNDSNADNYIKNRTHYEEMTVTDEFVLDFANCYEVSWGQTKNGYLYEYIPVSLTKDTVYNISVNNVDYTCTAFVDIEFGNIVIGNGAFVSDANIDNGLPFAIGNYQEGSSEAYVIVPDKEVYTIGFKRSVVHKLDKKFLPDDIGGKPDWNENNPESSGYIKNRPFYTTEDWYTYAPRQTIAFEDRRYELTDYIGIDRINEGQSYKIIFDDFEYIGTVWSDSDACYRLDFVTEGGIQVWFYDGYSLNADSDALNGNHTIEIYLWGESVTPLPEKYLPHKYVTEDNLSDALDEQLDEKLDEKLEDKMDKRNPEGSGTFRLNSRNDIDIIGDNSTSIGMGTLAGTAHSFVTGTYNKGTLGEYMEKTESYSSSAGRDTKVYFSDEYVFDGLTGIYTLVNAQYGTMSYSSSSVGLKWGKYMQYEDEKDSQKMRYVNSSLLVQSLNAIQHSGTLYTIQPLRSDKKGKYVVVVGNGSTEEALSDAHTLDWDGNAWYAGDVYVGSASGTDKDEGSKKLATEEYVDKALVNTSVDVSVRNIDKPFKMQNIGVLYENPKGYQYVAWCPGNLRWDERLKKYVSFVCASTQHVNGTTASFIAYIDPKTYEATEPVRCYTDNGATALVGCTAFWIDDDGVYKMLYKYTDNTTYLFSSTDNGVNWVKGSAVTGFSGSPWGITKLSNGRLIFGDDATKVGIYYSDDGGVNWSRTIPATAGGGYEAEACILELEEGKLIAIARYSMSGIGYSASGDSEPALVAFSEDYGTAWTAWKKSETITNMNASSCAGIVHNGMVDIFACSRWYWHGNYSNTDYVNTGKCGAITHYTATVENALADNFTNNGILTYANAVGDTSSQDFHSPCLASNGDEILLMWFDRIYPYTNEVTSHYFARGAIGGGLNYAPNDELVSNAFPYSSAKVEKLLRQQYTKLMTKINEIVISGGGTPDVGDDPENPISYVFDGCIMNFNYLDATKYDIENMTLTDSINGVVGKFGTGYNSSAVVQEFPEIRDNSLGDSYLVIPKNTLSQYVEDGENCELSIEFAFYQYSTDTFDNINTILFMSDGGGAGSLRVTGATVAPMYVNTNGGKSYTKATLEGAENILGSQANGRKDQLIHGVAVFGSDGTITIYRDGVRIGGRIKPDDFASWGGENLTRGFTFRGHYRTTRIYNRALTADEVLNNYNFELQSLV